MLMVGVGGVVVRVGAAAAASVPILVLLTSCGPAETVKVGGVGCILIHGREIIKGHDHYFAVSWEVSCSNHYVL